MVRPVKREAGSTSSSGKAEASRSHGQTDRRVLRSRYLAVKSLINDERDEITNADSDKFNLIINEVESLHQFVQKPREQVADAEALLDITSTLITSVKAHSSEGITPSDFVTCLLRNFGKQTGLGGSSEDGRNLICWKDVGIAVSHVFQRGPRCCTMIGPMDTGIKQRKAIVRRKHVRPMESARPEELKDSVAEERTDTDKNMATMFNILRKNRCVMLENLMLNRNSFAQTVENLFALSFLVKDGRAEIKVNEKGCHLVSPRNAPAANEVLSGQVFYSHFVFRFDFKDWKLMRSSVAVGEELMPHRSQDVSTDSQTDAPSGQSQASIPTTPIRKLSRNRGLVLQEQTVVEDSPEAEGEPSVIEDSPFCDSKQRGAAAIRKGKRKLT
ncbi:hypothetical protein FEM48_Zijuj12G0086500 [Ziziphus jujuba var. spinosa]|uniref:Non-structural maintenance of chromosomes element 4 n=1 Tax=Ziziphus jujuba var. spinosa TaxID=714518 RepID=A0A978UCA3_ZIZJJ|nr:hypothetical protein FEM48_Zijuj12G0086500 [Ziziphus jujuba var. spinosa]